MGHVYRCQATTALSCRFTNVWRSVNLHNYFTNHSDPFFLLMETRTASFTLEEYVRRLQAEASQASVLVHTCEQCSRLLIKRTPNPPSGYDLFCKLEGLAQISLSEAARAASGCALLQRWIPYCDLDSWLEQGSQQFYLRVQYTSIVRVHTNQAFVKLDQGGFPAWIGLLNPTDEVFTDLSPPHELSLDEGIDLFKYSYQY